MSLDMSYPGNQRPSRMASTGARRKDDGPAPTSSQGEDESASAGPSVPDKIQRRDGYTMITPEEEKRNHLLEVARKEAERAEARKQQRRPTPVAERPQMTGGERSHQESISKKQRETNIAPATKALGMRAKRELWAQQKKDKEDREQQTKKDKARAQAENNERKERQRAERQIADARMKRIARFGNSQPEQGSQYQGRREAQSSHEESFAEKLYRLQNMFPDCDRRALAEILQSTGGSVDKAVKLCFQA